jgi:hypothetical protein
MDAAYDHIQEEAFPDADKNATTKPDAQTSSLNADFQEAYKAISSTAWGARLGGFLGSVVKQVMLKLIGHARSMQELTTPFRRVKMSTKKRRRI